MQEEVRLLGKEDIPDTVKVLVDAFINDPFWVFAVPDNGRRYNVISLLFKIQVAMIFDSKKFYGIGRPVAGVAGWSIPEQPKSSFFHVLWAVLKCGGQKILLTPEIFSLNKLRPILKECDRMRKKYAPGKHYYLDVLAVSPDYHRRGFASKLVKPLLEQAQSDSLDVYLETMTEKNVAMYEHFGFRNMERVDFKKENISVWAMLKPANKKGA